MLQHLLSFSFNKFLKIFYTFDLNSLKYLNQIGSTATVMNCMKYSKHLHTFEYSQRYTSELGNEHNLVKI